MFTIVALSLCVSCADKGVTDPCAQLENLKLENARVISAGNKSGGHEFSFIGMFIGVPFFDLPASCRVELEITPAADSRIGAQVWLPRDNWTGKLQGIGNGGFAGAIDKLSLTFALEQGYAAAATDGGHVAGDRDGSWALHHPEKIRDYGDRAIHLTAVLAKQLITAYYGQGPKYSYFASGSNGGRQGLMEAQRYPDDYDGVLAGAPALTPTTGLPAWGWTQQQLDRPGAYISKDKLPAIAAATLKACDALDGVTDGLIDDPRVCHFKPETLLCAGKETDECLTAAQVQGLKAIYAGPGGSHHGFEPGGELGSKGGWSDWFTGSGPRTSIQYGYTEEFFRYLVYDDPNWSLQNFDLARDEAAMRKRLHEVLDADNPDLTRFAARGGKLILYHGWNDGALPPGTTVDYYETVRRKMGAKRAEGFVRLYMVPGLQHCIGGPGPNAFGQLPPGGKFDPARNINATLEAWVERDRAPGPIIATKYDSDLKPLIAPEKATALRSRPLCPYPQVARWSGQGSTDDAANFSCVKPATP